MNSIKENTAPVFAIRSRLAACLLLALVFAAGVFDHSLWSNDAREGAMIAEMVRSQKWLMPTFDGQPYFEKPPLMHWSAALLCRLTGHLNEGIIRIPSFLCGFGAAFIMALLAADMGRERAGWLAAFMCATSALYAEYSRVVLTDITLTFMVTFSLFLFWRAWKTPGAAVARHAAFIIVSALAFYAKGLLGPGLIWVSVCVFLMVKRQWRRLLLLPLIFLPVFLLAVLPWALALYREGGMKYIEEVFWANQFGRFLTLHGTDLPVDPYFVHKEPIWFYITHLPQRFLPWTFFIVLALARWFAHPRVPRGDLPLFLRVSLLAMLGVLHLSSAKVAIYAMPLFPIAFLITGLWLETAIMEWSSRLERATVLVTYSVLLAAGILASVLFLGATVARWFGRPIFWVCGPAVATIAAGLALLAGVFAVFMALTLRRDLRKNGGREAFFKMPVAFALICALLVTAAVPAYDFQRTYKPAADMAAQAIDSGRSLAIISAMERDHGQFIFYLNRPLQCVHDKKELRKFIAAHPDTWGLILHKKNRDEVLAKLNPIPLEIRSCEHPGYKSAEFSLVLGVKGK